MRIAMISTPFVPVPPLHYGGTELIVHELVEALLDRGHDVTLFATGDSRTRARRASPPVEGNGYTNPSHKLLSWRSQAARSDERHRSRRRNPTAATPRTCV